MPEGFDNLDLLMFEYTKKFGEGFPSFQLFRDRPDEECVAIVERCINEGKTAYELGLVSVEEDLQY